MGKKIIFFDQLRLNSPTRGHKKNKNEDRFNEKYCTRNESLVHYNFMNESNMSFQLESKVKRLKTIITFKLLINATLKFQMLSKAGFVFVSAPTFMTRKFLRNHFLPFISPSHWVETMR